MNMKRIVITTVLCFLASLTFGQKKALNEAKNELKAAAPNIKDAREQIKSALANPETAELAETWFVAGKIEDKQFDTERVKMMIGQQPNDDVMYPALYATLPYFEKAMVLDQRPDEKGKVKPKFTKEIRATLKPNLPYYINAGSYYSVKSDFKKAYECFKTYGDLRKSDLFAGEKWPVENYSDTLDLQVRYYAAMMASNIPDHAASAALYSEIKDAPYKTNSVFTENELYQRICFEYEQAKDSVNFEKSVKAGFEKFPEEDFYLLNLINLTISTGKQGEAISYLEAAIKKNSANSQFYDVLGQVYESEKNYDKAILNLTKALELEPDNADFLAHIGRVYFNLGVEARILSDDNVKDDAKYKELFQKSLDYFKNAQPHFEKLLKMDPKNKATVNALRSIYYSLTDNENYAKMDSLYGTLE
jgi:tetratricopeptide (TPR) repeat protein